MPNDLINNNMKVTFSVGLESQQHKAIHAIMTSLKFFEESRVATGGYMSEPILLITYSGAITPSYWEQASRNLYVEYHDKDGYYYYYSILIPDGYRTNKIVDFKLLTEQREVITEVKSFLNQQ